MNSTHYMAIYSVIKEVALLVPQLVKDLQQAVTDAKCYDDTPADPDAVEDRKVNERSLTVLYGTSDPRPLLQK